MRLLKAADSTPGRAFRRSTVSSAKYLILSSVSYLAEDSQVVLRHLDY
jgi:hypothetical protein